MEPYTTSELASDFDGVQTLPRSATEFLSQLDEQVLKLTRAYPQLRAPYQAFAGARQCVWPAQITDDSWAELQRTAAALAEAIRTLGNVDVQICPKKTIYRACETPLMPDTGTCSHEGERDWQPNPSLPARSARAVAGSTRIGAVTPVATGERCESYSHQLSRGPS